MPRQTRAKQEQVIEAVRHGLDGEEAAGFVRQKGFAMTASGVARHIGTLGGREVLLGKLDAGMTPLEILAERYPKDAEAHALPEERHSQQDLFEETESPAAPLPFPKQDLFETTKLSLRIPTDLYEAIRIAAKVEGKTQAQLIVDILTSWLSRMPNLPEEGEDAEAAEGE